MEQSTISGPFGLDRAIKPFAFPLGLASPMWMAYGAAASVGATWWWMSRMTRFVAPHLAETTSTTKPEAIAEAVVSVAESPLAAIEETALAAPTAVAEPLLEQPDELTLLRGVGPRVADALVARGVTTFAQLAAWTEQELAAFDAELKLLGRSKRYDFIGQAREMMAD